MKPYLAVLYDSFLESIQSRVLWMLLAAWTLLLAALFPLKLASTESYRINNRSFSSDQSAKLIMDSLADASAGQSSRAVRAIYGHLDAEFQQVLKQRKTSERKIAIGTLIEQLNLILSVDELYSEEAWPTAKNRNEIKELLEKSSRSTLERERLNRRLLGLAFPNRLNYVDGQATQISWAGIPINKPVEVPLEALRPIIEKGVFPLIMRIGIGIIAMLIAVIITSPMIPDMFQPGSLHLLLSKPISRSLLFLTKFLGGCIFVAINIIYLLVGLYLYAGLRLEIWNAGILWCIPLFVFMFIVYYSVSAFVGLVWKNAIICVVVTSVFWALCFGVGTLHSFFDYAVNTQSQATKILTVGDKVFLGDVQGNLHVWDDTQYQWRNAYGHVGGMRLMGPVWLRDAGELYYGREFSNTFGVFRTPDPRLEFARLPELRDPEDKTYRSPIWGEGRLDSAPNLPPGATQMIPWGDTFAVFTQDSFYAFDRSAISAAEVKYPAIASMVDSFFNVPKETPSSFQPVISGLGLSKPFDVNSSLDQRIIVAVQPGELRVWRKDGDSMEYHGKVDLEETYGVVSVVGCNDRVAIVGPAGKTPILVDLEKLQIIGNPDSLKIGRGSVKQIKTDEKGRLAILTLEGSVWIGDEQAKEFSKPALPGQGKASAIEFNAPGEISIAHSVNQVDVWNLEQNKSMRSIRPALSNLERVYYYILNPFYIVNPKPASVAQTIDHVMTTPASVTLTLDRSDLDGPQQRVDPWQPIWSNIAFILVMLGACCWYLHRQDL